uniref:Uncharacterized protein n=1 Tax=Panagrolaimus davidi TaxID=227884 RepID=A0A914QC60_9BILA
MYSTEQTSNDSAPPPPQLEDLQAFDHQNSKYKFCCGLFHAKTGAMITAISSFISLWFLIFVLILFINGIEKEWLDWAKLFFWIILFPVAICLFLGLITKNQYLLLPYIFYLIISAILSVTLAIILIYIYSPAEPEVKKRFGIESLNVSNEVVIGAAILYIIYELSFTAWYIWVIFLCYRYFRDLKNFAGRTFIGREPLSFN